MTKNTQRATPIKVDEEIRKQIYKGNRPIKVDEEIRNKPIKVDEEIRNRSIKVDKKENRPINLIGIKVDLKRKQTYQSR